MGTYSHINGEIDCDKITDIDILETLKDLPKEEFEFHKKVGGGYLFSFSIKELALEWLFEIFEIWKNARSKDSVTYDWHPLEAYILIRYESDFVRIDCVRIFDHEISHRKTDA